MSITYPSIFSFGFLVPFIGGLDFLPFVRKSRPTAGGGGGGGGGGIYYSYNDQ